MTEKPDKSGWAKSKQEKAWCVCQRTKHQTPNGRAVGDGAVLNFWCGFGCGIDKTHSVTEYFSHILGVRCDF